MKMVRTCNLPLQRRYLHDGEVLERGDVGSQGRRVEGRLEEDDSGTTSSILILNQEAMDVTMDLDIYERILVARAYNYAGINLCRRILVARAYM